eukprot:473571-Rhodomonas_salina.3
MSSASKKLRKCHFDVETDRETSNTSRLGLLKHVPRGKAGPGALWARALGLVLGTLQIVQNLTYPGTKE